MDNDTLEGAKRYTDDAFELAEEECQALRKEIEMLRERIEVLEVRQALERGEC